jgi:methylglyoxal synthase
MQVGARIVEGAVDALVFLPDPMNPHPHEADFRALIRVALLFDIPFALSPTSADHLARGMSAAEDEGGTAPAHGGGAA